MQTYCTGKKNLKFLNIAAFCTEGYLPAGIALTPGGLVHPLKRRGLRHLGRLSPRQQNAGAVTDPPTPTPDPNGDSTDNTDTTDTAGDTYTDDSGDYTDNTGDYTDDTGDYTDDTGDYTEE